MLADRLRQDMRFGFRTLGNSLGFTSVAALTLALAIGANTAVYSVFSALVSVPFPIEEVDGVVVQQPIELAAHPRHVPFGRANAVPVQAHVELRRQRARPRRGARS